MEKREPVDFLVRATGLSRRSFAKQYDVGEQVLLRLSQGRFTRIPPSIEEAIQEAYDPDQGPEYSTTVRQMLVEAYGWGELQDAYREWRAAKQPIGELPEKIPNYPGLSPAQRLARSVGSMSKLAAILHVHDFVVRRYVNGLTHELPASMRESMEALGWKTGADALDARQKAWLDKQNAQ